MKEPYEGLKILASSSSAKRISRRAFMSGSVVAAFSGGYLLSACSKSSSTVTGTGTGTSTGGAAPVLEDQLNFYHWAAYDDPKLFKRFTQELGPTTQIDVYASNEEAIAKLTAAAGSSGYDIVVPTGVYIPLMVENDLLEELDLSKIPNFSNLESTYANQPWDPGNKHSVCKDWGTTGWIVDLNQISTPINTWSDFLDVAMNEASGNVSVLDAPNELSGLYFWANGIDWTTEDKADIDAYEAFIVDQLAPHVKAFDSYPGYQFAQGNYALSQVWNGDARQGFNSFKDSSQYAWGLGAPVTELWMDNWTIVKGATHPEAAYAWINFILDPDNSLQDLQFHGYNTGITGVQEAAAAVDTPFLDMIFFTDEQVASFRAGAVNSAFDRLVEIYNKAKAAAGG
ncbi:MAG: spermidine/putrescine ABC transporter substrate-binding protein [Actinobacteria bacterium]|nr:spermidine/putrescine ABC transporter substrate-binding protein [Actinomycetota bacterium]